jgi:TonB family protein
MSLSMMREAVRITDRFYGVRDTDSIERQGQLQNAIVLVFIFHMILVMAFLKLQEFDVAHPKIIKDVDVSFEFTPPPPEPPPKAMELPKAISLTAGLNPNPGSEAAPSPLNASEPSMPSVKAPTTADAATMVPAKPVPSRKTTMAAPVAVTPTNIVKSDVGVQAPKQAPVSPPTPTIAGATSKQPLSGKETQGGTPGGNEAGTGTGGQGNGGTGTGNGDVGAGTGEGPAGGVPAIATRLPAGAVLARGNIAPYRKDMLMRIAQNWHPKKSYEELMVLITIDHDGHLVSSEIFQSSGNRKADKEALAAVQATEFAPLPDWYKGETLPFKIQLSKVEALNQ